MGKSSSVDDFKLLTSYEAVRRTLLQERFADRLSKPLGYWVLPNDRRLPLAFLGRTVGELLATPFEELSATPGIGQKKISSLVKLLNRATKDEPPAVPFGTVESGDETEAGARSRTEARFDPNLVSEALWSEWCEVVREFNVGEERLGRLAPSLRSMPTVIWHTPLSHYLGYTVGEIRRLRTHGEKRVRCVLEVFHRVYHTLVDQDRNVDVDRLLTPGLVQKLEDWISQILQGSEIPSEEEIRSQFAEPLLEQIKIDSGETVYRLAVERLGLYGEPQSVRAQARTLGVTRARIYQLLDDCAKVMGVRWPDGKAQLDRLVTHLSSLGGEADLKLVYGIRELCFPEKGQEGAPTTSDATEMTPAGSPVG